MAALQQNQPGCGLTTQSRARGSQLTVPGSGGVLGGGDWSGVEIGVEAHTIHVKSLAHFHCSYTLSPKKPSERVQPPNTPVCAYANGTRTCSM